jgi:hypothetical protein
MIWAETRDWVDVPVHDAAPKRLPARLSIAAAQNGESIEFWGFVDCQDQIRMSAFRGEIDRDALMRGKRFLILHRPPMGRDVDWDESEHRRHINACGDRLLELLFLLSTQGVAREKVNEATKPGKLGKRREQERRTSSRGYTIVRVPLTYQQNTGSERNEDGSTGRWVRPHVRRAHVLCSSRRVHLRTPEPYLISTIRS